MKSPNSQITSPVASSFVLMRSPLGRCFYVLFKAVNYDEVNENGRHPFLQTEVRCERIKVQNSKLILNSDLVFRSADSIRELKLEDCTWGHTRRQKWPLGVDILLGLLGPKSKI